MALSHLLARKRISLDGVRFLVLDETDKLLEVNKNPHSVSHVHQMSKIMKACTHPDLVSTPIDSCCVSHLTEWVRQILTVDETATLEIADPLWSSAVLMGVCVCALLSLISAVNLTYLLA